jgi:predicted lipoprotein
MVTGRATLLRRQFVRNAMLHTFSFIAVLVVSTGTAWAQSGIPHTPAEEKACRDDAHRFCKNVLFDEFQVASCLQEHRNRVSHACRTALQGHAR